MIILLQTTNSGYNHFALNHYLFALMPPGFDGRCFNEINFYIPYYFFMLENLIGPLLGAQAADAGVGTSP